MVAVNPAVQDNLGLFVPEGFQQNGIHMDMWGDAGRFRLNDLGPAYFQAFGRDA
jgi:hypothetical protein